MKKLLLLFLLVISTTVVFAQEEEPSGVMPNSAMWGLDVAMDRVSLALTFGSERKAEKALNIAQERLMEVQAMMEQNQQQAADKAAARWQQHVEVAQRLQDRMDEDAQERIQARINTSISHLEQTMVRLRKDNNTQNDVAAGNIENAIENIKKAAENRPVKTDAPSQDDSDDVPERAGPDNVSGQAGVNNFELMVSDAPADIADFDSLEVRIEKTRIFSAEGFEERDVDATVDLTEVVGEKAVSVLSTYLEPGTYNKVELYVAEIEGVVDNENVSVQLPSGKLQITRPFTVVDGEETKFVFDINVVRKGQGGYNLLPVIGKSGVVGKDVEVDEIPQCTEDVDCAEGELCFEGECEDAPECEADADCAQGEVCVDNECEIDVECTEDADCAEGELCAENECVIDNTCAEDADCTLGEVCIDGECGPDVECTQDTDCLEEESCVEGVCQVDQPDVVLQVMDTSRDNGTVQIKWEVVSDQSIDSTALYYSSESVEDVTAYVDSVGLHEDVSSGNFTATLDTNETVYMRAYAMAGGYGFWSEEASI